MKRFTDEEVEQAHNTDLASFLLRRGEKLKPTGNGYNWEHNKETVSINGNLWFNQYEQKGGEAIGFVKEFFGVQFKEAVEILLGHGPEAEYTKPVVSKVEFKPRTPFKLPERNGDNRRVYGYLVGTRGIDINVVNTFVKCGHIYEDKSHHNVVFVGYDSAGKARHASMRSTSPESNYKTNAQGSESEYSFHWRGSANDVYLFEAPIDMMSYITMNPDKWMLHSYVAACSVADNALMQFLKDNPRVDTVHICFDNDMPGKSAAFKLTGKLNEMGIKVDVLSPVHKDWNEDLLSPSPDESEAINPTAMNIVT